MALNGYLASLGTGEAPRLCATIGELATGFEIGRYGRAAPKFDPLLLEQLNERFLHESDFAAIEARLCSIGLGDVDAPLWAVIRGNLARLEDAQAWCDVCYGTIAPIIEEPEFLRFAAHLLPAEPWDEATWELWTKAVKQATGRSAKKLFQPLRRALTGHDHGPELKKLLPLIGRERAMRRLYGEGLDLAQANPWTSRPMGGR